MFYGRVLAADDLYGIEVYRNFREGLYSCYTSLTSGYRAIYDQHKFIKGGQYNVYWNYYEEQKDQFNWDRAGALKAELDSAKQTGLKTYLQIDAYGWGTGAEGGAMPRWLDSEIQVVDITGRDNTSEYIFWNRFPAPWDTKYHVRLKKFLEGLREKLKSEGAVKYVSGIEMGTGPMAQTSFSWNSIQGELIRQSGVNNINEFCSKYNDGVEKVIDIYAEVFKNEDIPLVLIGGNCYGTGAFEKFKKYAFSKYGLRLQYKMAGFGGWGTDTSCGRRPEFKTICNTTSCPGAYLHGGDNCPSAWCGQESGTSYNKWACKNYSDLFNTVIREDNLTTTCLYSDDFKSGNSANFGVIKDFAGKLGSKISFSNVSFPQNINVGGGGQVSVNWKNEGSTSLVWPQRVSNGDGTERERAVSYRMFLVFVEKSDSGNTGEWFTQYILPNPGTHTASWKQSQTVTDFALDVPGLKQGNYDVYLGLGPQLSNEDIRIGRSGFGHALWNEGNWGKGNEIEGDNMYLIKQNVVVSGNDSRSRLPNPFSKTLVPVVTPVIPTLTPGVACPKKSVGDANCDGVINILDFGVWKVEFVRKIGNGADFDRDGKVTILDFGVWKTNFVRG